MTPSSTIIHQYNNIYKVTATITVINGSSSAHSSGNMFVCEVTKDLPCPLVRQPKALPSLITLCSLRVVLGAVKLQGCLLTPLKEF